MLVSKVKKFKQPQSQTITFRAIFKKRRMRGGWLAGIGFTIFYNLSLICLWKGTLELYREEKHENRYKLFHDHDQRLCYTTLNGIYF